MTDGVTLWYLINLIFISYGIEVSNDVAHSNMKFPKHFIFSTASAAYQIEGGWNEDGKGENIWDRIVHSDPNYIQDHSNADVTCDSYHKYKEDIKCIRKIGFKAYRFSLSWARILPTGDITRINKNGIKYYMDLIDELIKNDIQPMVTLYHWDLPQTLQNLGGWLNPIIADYFEDFAYLVFSIYGNKVKWWITINEPSCIASGYGGVDYAPAMHLNGIGEYLAGHTLIKAHAKVYRLYENHFKSAQKGKISFALNGAFGMPVSESEEDVMAAERYNQFEFGWFAHPIYSNTGDYPPVMRDTVDRNSAGEGRRFSRLPSFTNEEIEFIKGTYDFIGINHYTSRLCTTGSEGENPSRSRDTKVKTSVDPNWPPTGVSWNKVVPEGLRKLLNWLKNEYGNLTVFITENGYSDNTTVLHDKGRIEYYKDLFYRNLYASTIMSREKTIFTLKKSTGANQNVSKTLAYLIEMLKAINIDGCNVIGFTTWSLTDNFEWRDGYTQKFGLYSIDFSDPDRTRVPKTSVEYFKNLISNINY